LLPANECTANDWFEDRHESQTGIPDLGAGSIPVWPSTLWSLFLLLTCQKLFLLYEKLEAQVTRVRYMFLPEMAVSFDLWP